MEDFVLREPFLDARGEHDLTHLRSERAVAVAHVGLLHVLLGDGRRSLYNPPLHGVGPESAQDPPCVHSPVGVEPLVLDGDHGVLERLRQLFHGHRDECLESSKGGDLGTVGGVETRDPRSGV